VLSFEVEAFHPTAPDEGSLIYFELVSGQRSQIVRVDNETRQTDTVNTGLRDPREPVVSHNGRILAVTSGDGLFLFDGRSARRLPVSGSDASFMPGDAEIVYAENGDGGSIDVIDLISMKVRTILSDSSELASPSVSPDGRQLVFAARRHGNMEIRVRDFPSRRETTLTGGNCNNYAPVWSGSNEIVFASDCRRGLGLPALYRARVDGIFK
jgi:Tol biopolymer transport system component